MVMWALEGATEFFLKCILYNLNICLLLPKSLLRAPNKYMGKSLNQRSWIFLCYWLSTICFPFPIFLPLTSFFVVNFIWICRELWGFLKKPTEHFQICGYFNSLSLCLKRLSLWKVRVLPYHLIRAVHMLMTSFTTRRDEQKTMLSGTKFIVCHHLGRWRIV